MLIGSVFSFFICNSYNTSQTISALFSDAFLLPSVESSNNILSYMQVYPEPDADTHAIPDPVYNDTDLPYSFPPSISIHD